MQLGAAHSSPLANTDMQRRGFRLFLREDVVLDGAERRRGVKHDFELRLPEGTCAVEHEWSDQVWGDGVEKIRLTRLSASSCAPSEFRVDHLQYPIFAPQVLKLERSAEAAGVFQLSVLTPPECSHLARGASILVACEIARALTNLMHCEPSTRLSGAAMTSTVLL